MSDSECHFARDTGMDMQIHQIMRKHCMATCNELCRPVVSENYEIWTIRELAQKADAETDIEWFWPVTSIINSVLASLTRFESGLLTCLSVQLSSCSCTFCILSL
jgi:hypothetical protein